MTLGHHDSGVVATFNVSDANPESENRSKCRPADFRSRGLGLTRCARAKRMRPRTLQGCTRRPHLATTDTLVCRPQQHQRDVKLQHLPKHNRHTHSTQAVYILNRIDHDPPLLCTLGKLDREHDSHTPKGIRSASGAGC